VPEVFIRYHRQDSSGHTGRLHDRLAAEFGSERIILDVEDIELGMDFAKQISDFVAGCDALLAVIGPQWLAMKGDDGAPRLEDPTTSSDSRSRPRSSGTSASSRS
jgi:hypothetical protein